MHELTSTICANSIVGESKSLIDKRDDKSYQVTKLKDGNCWMTQNLDYSGGGKGVDANNWTDSTVTWNTAAYSSPSDNTYGNYYSWEAARLACPSGWRLPTGNKDGEFQALADVYEIGNNETGYATALSAPLNFVPGGWIYPGSGLSGAGDNGYYWSSTAGVISANILAYELSFSSSKWGTGVYPSGSTNRNYGLSVRCLAGGS